MDKVYKGLGTRTAELEKMAFLVPFSTAGNGLWEMNKWEMGFGWLLWLSGFTL